MKKLFPVGIAILLVVVLSTVFMGTTTTRTSSVGEVGDFRWIKFNSVTFAAATDTAYFVLPSPPDYSTRAFYDTGFQITISTQTANGDSIDLAARWQSSFDNVNWETYTIGTDSASWLSTTTTTWDPNTTLHLGFQSYGGRKPYNRVFIYGRDAGNLAGAKAKVDIVGFD